MNPKEHIVIIGGGFAGTALARSLARHASNTATVTLLSQENYTTFNPLLAEVVGASILPGQVIAPIRQMLSSGQRFIMGKVKGVDLDRKILCYSSGIQDQELSYDQLVIAIGTRANMSFIPGMDEHGIALKLVGDALRVRNRVIERLEQASQSEDPRLRRWLTHFIVVGGGFSGVEVGGEIADLIRSASKLYANLDPKELRVTLVHSGERLLPELTPKLGVAAYKSMSKRNIDIRLNSRVTQVDAHGIEVKGLAGSESQHLAGGTLICTIGTKVNPLIEKLTLPKERNQIVTEGDMSVPGRPDIWAIGDCAMIRNHATGEVSPPTAQFATAQAKQLGRNIGLRLKGEKTQVFSYKSKGMLATVGHLNGVAQFPGCSRITGLPAWLLWRAFYLMLMPTLARKIRIFVEWNWGLLFESDTTHLRFTASDQADEVREDTQTADKG